MVLFELLRQLENMDILRDVTLKHLFNFIHITNKLRNDILLAQPASHPADEPPIALPPSVTLFLSQALDLPCAAVTVLWEVLRTEAWGGDLVLDHRMIFERYGHPIGLSECGDESRLLVIYY